MDIRKIKVVWICHLSNAQIRKNLKYNKCSLLAVVRKLLGKSEIGDFAVWNSNAIAEFQNFEDVELHVIAPHYHISRLQEFDMNGVHYHFFASEEENSLSYFKSRICSKIKTSYPKNTRLICNLIDKIQPDLIHMIGAENPYYSESALSLPKNIPLIVSLQTLMSDPDFFKNYPISKEMYDYQAGLEAKVISRADYIGTKVEKFRQIIHSIIAPQATFLDMSLAVGEDVVIKEYRKQYDFVYFAADISKAIDYALEAFAFAKRFHPEITLHVVGGYHPSLMLQIQTQMKTLGLSDEVDFTGRLATHDDVLEEIRKARFALLPLKIDLISGTIREAMSNGLPVVSTITPLTPELNEKRESILLSEKEDYSAMADNMCRLLDNDALAESLKQNAAETMQERYSNATAMKEWKTRYYEVIANTKK